MPRLFSCIFEALLSTETVGKSGIYYYRSGKKWGPREIPSFAYLTGSSALLKTMLLGEYTHTLDEKGRISLPSKFRKEFGNKVIVTHGLDNCLFIFSEKSWNQFSEELSKLSFTNSDNRKFTRFILGGAVEADVDSAGRILLPDFLRKFAGLGNRAIIAGVHDRAEIWSEKQWGSYKRNVEKNVDMLAERLGEMGVSL